jgi:hypothetical protein
MELALGLAAVRSVAVPVTAMRLPLAALGAAIRRDLAIGFRPV